MAQVFHVTEIRLPHGPPSSAGTFVLLVECLV